MEIHYSPNHSHVDFPYSYCCIKSDEPITKGELRLLLDEITLFMVMRSMVDTSRSIVKSFKRASKTIEISISFNNTRFRNE